MATEYDFPCSETFRRYEAFLNNRATDGTALRKTDCITRAEDMPTGLRIWFDVPSGFGFQNVEGGHYIRPLQPRGSGGRVL